MADGIVEDILTALGRFKWLFVSARGLHLHLQRAVRQPPSASGAELGVRYLLDGSVRRSGDRMRITGRLIDAERGTQIWADQYDGKVEDIFELQDRITESCRRRRRTAPAPCRDREGQAHAAREAGILRPVPPCPRVLLRRNPRGRRACAATAREITKSDPGYAQPYALKAWCYVYYIAQGWSRDPAMDGTLGVTAARAAIERERDDPTVLWMSAQAIGYLAHDIETALFLLDRALVLNPSSAPAYTMSGWVRCWAGRQQEAIPHFHCAMRLSPFDRTMVAMLSGLSLALCMDGKYEESIGWASGPSASRTPGLRVTAP